MSELKVFEKESESDNFQIAFTQGGSYCSASCEYCDRTYFCDRSVAGDYNEGEYEQLCEKAKAEPDKYIEVSYAVDYGHFDKQYIVGCKCNTLRRYENFLIANRERILHYFKRVLEQKQTEVKEEEKEMEPFKEELK